jgi:hypothetical protein
MLSETPPPSGASLGGVSPAKAPPPARGQNWLVMAALVALCAIPYYRGYEHRSEPLGEDEIYWIGQTYYYHLAFEKRDWSNPDWQLLPARENPALGKFVIGAGLQLNGLSVTNPDWLGVFFLIAKDRPNGWGKGRDFAERQAVVDRMSPAVRDQAVKADYFDCPMQFVTTARAVMAVFGMISVLGVYILASFYTGRVAALLAALLFVLHPAVAEAYMETSVDILAVAFSLAAVIHFVLIERVAWQRCRRPGLCRALLCASGGVSLAFAVGSKLNAAVVGFLGVAMGLAWLASFLRCQPAGSRESCKAMLAMLAISLLVFMALNPVNYPDPARGVWASYADQQRSLAVQNFVPTDVHGPQPLHTTGQRLLALAKMTALHPAVFALVMAAFFWDLFKNFRRGGPLPVIALWWIIAVLAVGLWLPFSRPRYVLPVVVPSVIMICIAAGGLAGRRRRNSG